MLPRLIASLLCLLGAAAAGLGVASATVWRPADTLTASATSDTYLVTDPGVLDLAADRVTVTAHASGPVVVALGRTADVEAWIGTDRATHVTGLASSTALATEAESATGTTSPSGSASATGSATESASPTDTASATESASPTGTASPSDTASPADGSADQGADGAPTTPADPTGSDLWVDQVTGTGTAVYTWQREAGRWSVLVAAPDGGPVELTLAWPQVVTTPWLRPGLVAGGVLLALGLLWWVLLVLRSWRPTLGAGLIGRTARLWDTLIPIPAGAAVVEETTRTGRHSRVAPAGTAAEPESPATPAVAGRRAAPVPWTVARPDTAAQGASSRSAASTVPTPDQPAAGAPSAPAEQPAPGVHAPAAGPTTAAAGAPGPGGDVPLTRRALREMREREERERAAAARGVPPADASEPEAAPDQPVAPAPHVDPGEAPAGTRSEVGGAPDGSGAHRHGRRAAPVPPQDSAATTEHPVMPAWSTLAVPPARPVEPAAPAPAEVAPSPAPASEPPEAEPVPAERPRGGWARRTFGRRRGRRPDVDEPWIPEPEPEEPVALPEPPTAAGPSGDAWRRAWGLPAATTQAREQRFGTDPRASRQEDR